jgi:hypothetical protein
VFIRGIFEHWHFNPGSSAAQIPAPKNRIIFPFVTSAPKSVAPVAKKWKTCAVAIELKNESRNPAG